MGNYMNGVGLIDISELEGEQTHKAQMQEIWLLLIYCSDIFPHKPPAYPLSQTLGKIQRNFAVGFRRMAQISCKPL